MSHIKRRVTAVHGTDVKDESTGLIKKIVDSNPITIALVIGSALLSLKLNNSISDWVSILLICTGFILGFYIDKTRNEEKWKDSGNL
jgi:hypothetical protein